MFNVKEKEALEAIFSLRSSSSKPALGSAMKIVNGGISSKEERSPPKPWRTDDNGAYTVMLYRHLRNGTMFLPIEKTGKTFYYYAKSLGNRRYLKDRKWAIGDELYVKASQSVARSAHRDKDGIFGAGTWCIVRKDAPRT